MKPQRRQTATERRIAQRDLDDALDSGLREYDEREFDHAISRWYDDLWQPSKGHRFVHGLCVCGREPVFVQSIRGMRTVPHWTFDGRRCAGMTVRGATVGGPPLRASLKELTR